MRRMARLEGVRKSCAFRYMFFRQSPYSFERILALWECMFLAHFVLLVLAV